MIKIVINRIRKEPVTSAFLLFGLVVAMLMFSVCTSFLTELLHMEEDKESMIPPNGKMFTMCLGNERELSKDQLSELFSSMDKSTGVILNGIMVSIDGAGINEYFESSAEWFASETEWHYPVGEGRYYTAEEIRSGAKVTLIGRNLKKYVDKRAGKEYINICGSEYEVIGIVGYENKRSLWDARVFMPATALPDLVCKQLEGGNLSVLLYNKLLDTENQVNKLYEYTKGKFPDASMSQLYEPKAESMIETVSANPDSLFFISILGYLVSLVYAVNVVSFWIGKRKFEIGVRKAFGYSNTSISILIIKEMFGLALLAFGIGIFIQAAICLFATTVSGYTVKLYASNIIVGIVVVILTTIATSIWPIRKALKIQPIEAMKR